MIRPYLKDLINDHIPVWELGNEEDNSDTKRGEWKAQLVMQNNCIFVLKILKKLVLYVQQVNQ